MDDRQIQKEQQLIESIEINNNDMNFDHLYEGSYISYLDHPIVLSAKVVAGFQRGF